MKYRRHFLSMIFPIIATSTVPVAATEASDHASQQQIRALISITYDLPGRKVETSPIVVADGFAIADWIQGEKGGRALLHNIKGKWEIMVCGGDGLKDVKMLGDAGLSKETATYLVKQLSNAEQSVSADQIKRFGLFGTPHDPRLNDHHAHPQAQH